MVGVTSTTATIPPVSPHGTLRGALFQFSQNLVAFESCPNQETIPSKKCVLIGGLSDGLLPTPYTCQLEQACHECGWSLVQPILSSSYLGFGNGDLERDTNELSALLWYLTHHRFGTSYSLVGHSTGCQNSIHFLHHGMPEMVDKTKVVVLQAPVSDREHAMMDPGYQQNIQTARSLSKSGKEDEMMPRSALWAPITARRFLDLYDVNGRDDFFSSDLSDTQLVERLSHVGELKDRQVLVAFSGQEEYVPDTVDKRLLLERLCSAMNHVIPVATPLYLEHSNHNLSSDDGDRSSFVQRVAEILKRLPHG